MPRNFAYHAHARHITNLYLVFYHCFGADVGCPPRCREMISHSTSRLGVSVRLYAQQCYWWVCSCYTEEGPGLRSPTPCFSLHVPQLGAWVTAIRRRRRITTASAAARAAVAGALTIALLQARRTNPFRGRPSLEHDGQQTNVLWMSDLTDLKKNIGSPRLWLERGGGREAPRWL